MKAFAFFAFLFTASFASAQSMTIQTDSGVAAVCGEKLYQTYRTQALEIGINDAILGQARVFCNGETTSVGDGYKWDHFQRCSGPMGTT